MNRGKIDRSRKKRTRIRVALSILFFLALSLFSGIVIHGQSSAVDPGLRGGPPGAGGEIDGLTVDQGLTFEQNLGNFAEVNTVKVSNGVGKLPLVGLGPTFDSNSCASCHAQPAIGGSSPAVNNLFSVFQVHHAQNTMPFFETLNGPTVIARFPFQADGPSRSGRRSCIRQPIRRASIRCRRGSWACAG